MNDEFDKLKPGVLIYYTHYADTLLLIFNKKTSIGWKDFIEGKGSIIWYERCNSSKLQHWSTSKKELEKGNPEVI